MNKEALTPQETEKEKIILGITSFVQENRKDYAEEIYRLWIEPFIDASQPSLPLDADLSKQEFERFPELAKTIEWFAANVGCPGTEWNKLLREINNALLLSKVSYGSGMKWVKCTKRLPEISGSYYVRIGNLNDKTVWTKSKIIERFNEGLENMYWLDESSATLSDEDIERMAREEFSGYQNLFGALRQGYVTGFKAAQHLK